MIRPVAPVVMNEKVQLALAIALGVFLVVGSLFLLFGPPVAVR